jgi:hypothetical protein
MDFVRDNEIASAGTLGAPKASIDCMVLSSGDFWNSPFSIPVYMDHAKTYLPATNFILVLASALKFLHQSTL